MDLQCSEVYLTHQHILVRLNKYEMQFLNDDLIQWEKKKLTKPTWPCAKKQSNK